MSDHMASYVNYGDDDDDDGEKVKTKSHVRVGTNK